MLKQAEKCLRYFFPDQKDLFFQRELPNLPKTEKKILFFGHSINELGSQRSLKIIETVDPTYVIFIEPGTPAVFQEVLSIRRILFTKGYESLYPCPTLRYPCPLSPNHIAHVYGKKNNIHHNSKKSCVVRKKGETKFSFLWDICIENDGLQVITGEVLKREMAKTEIKRIRKGSTGDLITFTTLKKIKEDYWRIKPTL